MISNVYIMRKLFALAMVFLIVGGVNLGIKAFTGQDVLTYLTGKGTFATNLIFFLVGVSALGLALFRDSYLPFLGPTIVPCSLLTTQVPEGADFEVRVNVRPGAKILYWAAESANKDLHSILDWRKAYKSLKNAGVTVADANGEATLRVRKPQPYTVLVNRELSPHIHYRMCEDEGTLSRVQTVTLDGTEYFENVRDVDKEEIEEFVETPAVEDHDAAKLNRIAESTANLDTMVQSGAIDASSPSIGAPLEAAF